MEIENRGMSKQRKKFHMRISGSYEEYLGFYEKLCELSTFSTVSIKITVAHGKVDGSIICKSSNYKKFDRELNKLIKEFTE